jgi:hypothetical protein
MSDTTTSTTELEAEIEAQRERLADTVDRLGHKLDLKAQAKERAAQVRDRATTASGKPRPELVALGVSVLVLGGLLVWWRRR